jgi:hypothetical protein
MALAAITRTLLTVASFAAEEEVFDAVKSQSRLVPDC